MQENETVDPPKASRPAEFEFSIGADPEFTMTLQSKRVSAGETLQRILNGKKGIGTYGTGGFKIGDYGRIGNDGAASTAELRPNPSKDPAKLIDNIKNIIETSGKYLSVFDMSTICDHAPIGGHIHFEVPKGEAWTMDKSKAIHNRMASFYLPVLISENKTSIAMRLQQSYGSITDFKVEHKFDYPDGEPGYTYEFRTPSAEWMTTPRIAKATIAYFGVVYHEILKHPRKFNELCGDIIFKSDKMGGALQVLAVQEYELLTNQIVQKIRKAVRQFEMYGTFKDDVDFILSPKKVMAEKIEAQYNIALGWNILSKATKVSKKDIMSEKKLQERAKESDFDGIKDMINISYNNDTNVATYADALAARVAAFNWKLSKNYYIFGMRKGIDGIFAMLASGEMVAGQDKVKTTSDKRELDRLFSRMRERFQVDSSIEDRWTIDLRSKKPKRIKDSAVMIGLPYNMRTKKDIKPFLELVWNIERGTTKPVEIDMKTLINTEGDLMTSPAPEEERGEIYKALTAKSSSEDLARNVVMSQNTATDVGSRRAAETVAAEAAQQEAVERAVEALSIN